jgi:diguanylate cyclase (GGDEF)-like protein
MGLDAKAKVVNVLLIDDDEDEFVITRDLFAELGNGYRLSWVDNYDSALDEIAKEATYDVCLLDFHLGGHTGVEFLTEAVSRNCTLPIILLTGQGDYQVDLAAMKAGASDYLDKGELTPRILERSLRYALERKRNEERIRFLAYYDQLTHLPNRTLFYDRLRTSFASARRHNRCCAVLFLDIDNFKRVNDSLGHSRGDQLIKEVGQRLVSCIRKEDSVCRGELGAMLDTVARLGGDEFTILLSEIKESINASAVAKRIREVLLAPIRLDRQEVTATASIGIAVFPQDGEDIETVVKNADIAMYNAKAAGKNGYRYFNQGMNAAAQEHLTLEQDLRRSLEADGFVLRYQPIMDIRSRAVTEVRALLFWNCPGREPAAPEEYLPMAEETTLIYDLGERVFTLMAADRAAFREHGLDGLPVVASLSPRQFRHQGLSAAVENLCRKTGMDPERLTFEITEQTLIPHFREVESIMDDLRLKGVRLSLGGFGSGYSSLVMLRKMRLDRLSIDRSLIHSLSDNAEDATITGSLVSIGRSLGVRVVAVGVESEPQREILSGLDCRWGEGPLFSRPLTIEELAAVVHGPA